MRAVSRESCTQEKKRRQVTRGGSVEGLGQVSLPLQVEFGTTNLFPTDMEYHVKPQHCIHQNMNPTIILIPVGQMAWVGVSKHFFIRVFSTLRSISHDKRLCTMRYVRIPGLTIIGNKFTSRHPAHHALTLLL